MIILFSAAYTGEEIKEFHDLVVDLETAHVFSTIAMLTLSEGDLSAPSGRKQLKDLIHRQCSEMQKIRQEHECLFSATHLSAFYREAIRHTSETLFKPFSFIDVSRQGNAVSLYLSQHIATSLNLAAEYKLSYENTTSFIASAILMDAYPPGMHCGYALEPSLAYATDKQQYSTQMMSSNACTSLPASTPLASTMTRLTLLSFNAMISRMSFDASTVF
ncbi:MAG: hypothetical protein M4579_005224 [Chaenotheca gracillima]|nr:MAG: hypothetical protein M4579_005224 [Chaenotheca gracillima]